MAKEYNITKTTGRCRACGKEMAPGDAFVATVREAPAPVEGEDDSDDQFAREDYCLTCWDAAAEAVEGQSDVFGIWRSRVPRPKEKRKTFVDDEVLIGFLERLEGAEEEAKVQFRFVLALILMRKKRLIYERSAPGGDGRDVWTMRLRGTDSTCEVIDPQLNDEKIADLSHQLGVILEGEL